MGSYHTALINTIINNVGQGIVTIAGALTIGIGVIKVLNETMSAGALMASMMIVWRILAPIKTAFSIFTQSVRIKKSSEQLDRLMAIELDNTTFTNRGVKLNLDGNIRFEGVSIRYSQDSTPALLGIDLFIKKGESIAVTGHDGAGKSTLLKLILQMYKPQSGKILLDRFNLQQLNPTQVRRAIGYCPTVDDLFFGTISQNLRLVDPTLTDEEMEVIAKKVGMLDSVNELPNRFNSRIGDQISKRVSGILARQISLARAMLNNPSIILLDEPEQGLREYEVKKLAKLIESIKREKTVVLVTKNSLLLSIVDRTVVLDAGKIIDIKVKDDKK
jgi:ATP-binding cassette subfamily C protein/ATP-binding cassette subfamily C protein LapB